jgi:hypothetical protein
MEASAAAGRDSPWRLTAVNIGWPMTRNNARIITKYLREAGWSEVTALRQELAASKARVQEMGRHNATEAEHFRAICRRIERRQSHL